MSVKLPIHRRLAFRLSALLGMLVLAAALLWAYSSIQLARTEFFRVMERQFNAASQLAGNSLDIVGQMARAWAYHFAEDGGLSALMASSRHETIAKAVEEMRASAQCDTVVVLDQMGRIVHHSAFPEKDGESLMAWQIVRRAVNEGKPSYAIIEEFGNFIIYGSGITPVAQGGRRYVVLAGFRISDELVQRLSQDTGIDLTFVRRTAVMASSFNTAERKLIDSPVPYLDYQTLFNNPRMSKEVRIGDRDFYASVRPLQLLDPAMDGSLLLSYPAAELQAIVNRLQREFLWLYALGMVLFVLVIWRVSVRMMQPLRMLSERAVRISRGDMTPVRIERHDEIGIIASSFNDLIGDLAGSKEKIERHAEELETMVEQRTQELREANRELIRQATHDALTGLPNRKLFNDRLHQTVALAHRAHDRMGLMFVDLDRFKWVNDTYGHAAGDELLKEVSLRILGCLREGDTVARLGGDEFTVILSQPGLDADIENIANRLLQELKTPFDLTDAAGTQIGGSIGIAVYPEHGESAAELMLHADHAMYSAKKAGRGTYCFWNSSVAVSPEK